MGFLSDDGGQKYNLCHCVSFLRRPSMTSLMFKIVLVWSNFEIGDMDFWRGEAYQKFFEHLENKGGFYYEVKISSF